MFYLYLINNIINQKIYVGITNNINTRWSTHKRIALGGRAIFPNHYQALHQAISKYGINNFTIETVQIFSSEDEAYLSEEWWISYLKEINVPNYNIAGGGKGTGSGINHPMFGKKLSQNRIDAIRISSKEISNRPEIKEANKQRMIARNWTGENHPNFGLTISEKTSNKISAKLIGRVFSKKHKSAISFSLTGKIKSAEHRQNISLSKIGKYIGTDNPNSKLLPEDITKILELIKVGLSSRKIGKMFNISKTTILRIKNKS